MKNATYYELTYFLDKFELTSEDTNSQEFLANNPNYTIDYDMEGIPQGVWVKDVSNGY